MGTLISVTNIALLKCALETKKALIFKHSTRCPISAMAHDAVMAFLRNHPDGPDIYKIDVIRDRETSDTVTMRTGIPHQSPQLLVIVDGALTAAYSHWDITYALLERIANEPPSAETTR